MTSSKNVVRLLLHLGLFLLMWNTANGQYKPLRMAAADDLRIRHEPHNTSFKSSSKKLSERGYQRVAYIIYNQDYFTVHMSGVITTKAGAMNIEYLGGNSDLNDIFHEYFNKTAIELVELTELQRTRLSKVLTSKRKLHKNVEAEILFGELRESIDAIVVISEGFFTDFFTSSGVPISAKGIFKTIYKRNAFVYAGHEIRIYDVNSRKVISSGRDRQFSADYLMLPFNKDKRTYTEEELEVISKTLKERYRNNVRQSFRFLKIF